ncbi:MAG: hypothetical protein JXB29_00025 [Sedimentisphaerales bacterium]|nr:hypothetical protein [Sedimentisphaerales bacterium]
MKEKDLLAAIVELNNILEDMKALLEWHRLKQSEAKQQSGSNLRFYDVTIGDLNNKYSEFLLLASRIHTGFDNQNIPQSKLRAKKNN